MNCVSCVRGMMLWSAGGTDLLYELCELGAGHEGVRRVSLDRGAGAQGSPLLLAGHREHRDHCRQGGEREIKRCEHRHEQQEKSEQDTRWKQKPMPAPGNANKTTICTLN